MKLQHLLLVFLLSSCSTTIKNLDLYQKQFLSRTEFMPSSERLDGKAPKIVVFPLDENDNPTAKQSQLGNSIANNVENILAKHRLAELVDRNAATKLQKEIALAEMHNTGSYKGPKVADYAVSGTIANADFSSKFVSGTTYINPKNFQVISLPPRFIYNSNVAGNIKIYELPSLTVIEAIEFEGKRARTENVQQKGGVSIGMLQIGGEKVKGVERDDGLVRRAGQDAVEEVEIAIKNAFAKTGYILEKRVNGSKTIFKINLGSMDGIKQNDKFEVIGKYEVENPISNETETERRIIATGTVSDIIDPKTCFVIINDEKKANTIRLGDMIKMKYEKSRFKSFLKWVGRLME